MSLSRLSIVLVRIIKLPEAKRAIFFDTHPDDTFSISHSNLFNEILSDLIRRGQRLNEYYR